MIPEYIWGPIANVFTAWHADGRFDEDGQRSILDFLCDTGAVSAYFVRSGMGQMYTYEYDDVIKMTDLACRHMGNKGPVLVGTAGIWDRNLDRRPDPKLFTQQAIELSRYAEQAGAAGVVHTMPEAVLPAANETHADVIMRYFEAVCSSVGGPVIIYQPPNTRPEYHVDRGLAAKLADLPQVKGMKLSTNDARYIYDVCHAVMDKDFGYIAGSECAFLPALYAGARACIGQGSSLNPAIIRAVQERFEADDRLGAIEAQRSVNRLVDECVGAVEWFKRYITEKGYPVQPHARVMHDNPYFESPARLTDEAYARFKSIYEEELARYDATAHVLQ